MTRTTRTTRRSTTIVAAAAVALGLSACGGDDTDGGDDTGGEAAAGDDLGLIDDGTLVVAMSGEFQPFSYFEGNTLTGFDHDIGVAIAEEMGLEVDAQTGAFDTLIQGISANRYDVLIASMTPTEERDEQVDFTDSYYVSGAQAFVAPGTECTDIAELDSPTIGVASGTTYQDWLNENGGDWVGEIRTFSSDVTALQDVSTGRLDAAMTDRNVGLYQIQESGLDLVECGEPVFTEEPAFAVEEGNTALRDALNEALATIKEDGTYAEISEEYFGKDISTTGGDDAAETTEG
ncbi:transporter substrate-binding domain-containing protein [Ornithinimicrobium sp. CNJ-824]|uniref:transporter substrate-binding domain-containing protein n=1 Tax=Ornithinimicrobium sp. CNJ-824 TaxID=1904966 RepID=UPI0009FB762A|nr:transporter substrate-binding domain-containing protein [Ornithinimicrobium sp. CNJ-824]